MFLLADSLQICAHAALAALLRSFSHTRFLNFSSRQVSSGRLSIQRVMLRRVILFCLETAQSAHNETSKRRSVNATENPLKLSNMQQEMLTLAACFAMLFSSASATSGILLLRPVLYTCRKSSPPASRENHPDLHRPLDKTCICRAVCQAQAPANT